MRVCVCVCVHASSSASLSGHCNLMMTETNIWLLLTVWTNQMVKNLLFKVFDILVRFHLNASCTQSTTFKPVPYLSLICLSLCVCLSLTHTVQINSGMGISNNCLISRLIIFSVTACSVLVFYSTYY